MMWNEKYLSGMLVLCVFFMISLMLTVMRDFLYPANYYVSESAVENSFLLSSESFQLFYVFQMIGPLISAVVCGNLYSEDLRNGNLELMYTRESRRVYHARNLMCIMLASFVLFLVPLLINLLVSAACFSWKVPMQHRNYYFSPEYARIYEPDNMYSFLRVYHPYIYISILIVINSIAASLGAVCSYGASVLTRVRAYLCNTAVFFIFLLYNLLTRPSFSQKRWISFSLMAYTGNLSMGYSLWGFVILAAGIMCISAGMVYLGMKRESR